MDGETLLMTLLFTLPYYLCALAAWGTMTVCSIAVRKRLYPHRLLWLVGAMLLVGAYFYLLAASARMGGYIDRVAIAWQLRAIAAAGGVLWLVWIALFVRAMVSVEKRR